jgi:hypothetical protein
MLAGAQGWALNRAETEPNGLVMAETGRKPYASYDVAPFPNERLKPPASLGELERRPFWT